MRWGASLIGGGGDQQATMLAYIDNFWLLGVAVMAK